MTRLTLETDNGTYMISVPKDSMTVFAVVDELVRPILLAAGYHRDNIDDAIPDCDKCEDYAEDEDADEEADSLLLGV